MKRQMKIAAVVSATALLAIGASFTSMAAQKGTWALENDGWYCYDADGDRYEDEFCEYNGKDFYVGDDGLMLTSSWVEYDGNMYYVNSYGEKTTNAWKLLTPYEADEDADEEWYYFQSSGKIAKSTKKDLEGKRYYFDAEGKMLTGWVDKTTFAEATSIGDNTYFCDENGARVAKAWVETTVPGADEDDDDTFWYYIGSKYTATTGKAKNINGETYFFNNAGQMLDGWIVETSSNVYETIDGSAYKDGETIGAMKKAGKSVFFAADDGHAKKNKWIYEWANTDMAKDDADVEKAWFWIEKDGTVFVPATASLSNATVKKFDDAESNALINDGTEDVQVKTIDSKYYAFDKNGVMLSGLLSINGNVYYFGDENDGARKTGSVTLKDSYDVEGKFLFDTASDNKGVGVTGPKNGKLYNDGLLITAKDNKYTTWTVAGSEYIINKAGSIQTTKKVYKDGDDVICDATNATFSTVSATKGAVTGLK